MTAAAVPARISRHAAQDLAGWWKARRYAVPRWMIERATERRLAGDWAGACAAARITVELDPAEISREHGAEVAGAVLDDLRHLVPDLLRWHLPRAGQGRHTISTRTAVVLAEYGGSERNVLKLYVATPTLDEGPQRLRLRFGRAIGNDDDERFGLAPVRWVRLRHLWDARRTRELLERCGGDRHRAPFFRPDGTPVAGPGPGGDGGPAELAERVALLQDRGEVEAAFDAAGIDLDLADRGVLELRRVEPRRVLAELPLALTRFAPEMRVLGGDRYEIVWRWQTPVLIEAGDRPRVRVAGFNEAGGAERLPAAVWRRLPDLDLLRAGRITPEDLHPLVRSALFPARPEPDRPVGPPEPSLPGPVRVRCRGEWHRVQLRDGRLHTPHTDHEHQREAAVHSLGGATAGCFAVLDAWTGRGGRLPRRMRAQREELFLRAQHGDTPGVLALLDAGVEPNARDGRGRTLLHMLHALDHEELLPRLLRAGLDIDARDERNRTPLHLAIGGHGSQELIRALLDAGARIDAADDRGSRPVNMISANRRPRMRWLARLLAQRGLDPGTDWLKAGE
ncbi:ankyrin repeat domain-containing protein [Actinomadura rugatobispora]|uniref:Ankyrin repeat domain-containing protein n=1 Tax=Actinomadura rugatobispora TaxID=1994 RepID=A0ABW1AAC1_9ACTN|nr:hypothetical protein GCM10010200_005360 [Actinomadura rugatobispora]